MREKLNSNPLVQMAVIGVLLVAGAIFIFTSMGGGESKEEGGGSLSASAAPPGEGAAPSPSETPAVPGAVSPGAGSAIAERPLPHSLMAAWKANQTVVLLFVHNGGIDDDLVKLASTSLDGMSGVTTFIVPADRIARYAAITEGVGVERVPALVVLRPRRLDQSVPTASVSYGFQDAESIVQAVIDAGYKGPTLEYHP
ncbi:MAG TPA: hypothetical protein VFK14_13420 [Solirubrobacterales bacterium]|nr:hypothetical protein [Solirubrobacterales bacterium]